MATNVSYASGDTILESLVVHTLPDFGPHGDGITNNNFLFAGLKLNGSKSYQVIEGGLEFWNGIYKAENSNFGWQAKTGTMATDLQDPSARLRFDIKAFTGSVVINKLDEARNKGRAMIKEFARSLREQAEMTIPNQFNSAFWNTSPGANEPESVPTLISATPTTGTVGGLSRSGNAYLQNVAYTTAVSDIGSEAGISALDLQIRQTSIGQSGRDSVDLVIMTDTLYSGLIGYLATLNRYRPDNMMAQLGFDTLKLGKATIGYENTNNIGSPNEITSDYVYGINRNHMAFKVLRDGNFYWEKGFERVGQTLNKAMYFYVFCNLTVKTPRAHFVMTSVSTT